MSRRGFGAVMLALGVIGLGTPASAEEAKIRIGIQSVPPDEAYAAKDWLEPYGITGEIVQFSSGGDMLQAFLAGRIDVANGGSARLVSMAASRPKFFSIIAAHQYGGDRYAVLVRPESPIKTAADLKGKKVGAVTGSGTFETFRVFLENHGMSTKDLQVVNMKVQDIRSAVQQELVEAGVAWEPHVAIAETTAGLKRVMSMKGVNASPNFYLVNREFADKNPDTVTKFVASLIDLAKLIENRPDEAGKLAAQAISQKGVAVDPKALELSFTRLTVDRKVTDDLIAELVPIAESMKDANRIKAVPDFKALVDDRFYVEAMKIAVSSR